MGGNVGKLISVIIPVYNKAPYLERCIESLVNLKHHEFVEAIFVDDCSTDKSLEIIKRYESRYDMIKCIQMPENTGGPALPRNEGMKEAQGVYLTFLDADDWLDHEHFTEFVERINADNSDIGFGRTFKHTDKSITQIARFQSYDNLSGLIPYEIEKVFRAVGPPGKIFKKALVEKYQLQFKHMKYGEDKLFFIELIAKAASATITTLPVYHVNRYSHNVSLVKSTTPFEKAKINYNLLKEVINLNIPYVAKTNAISRFLELDFMSRFFFTKTFTKTPTKKDFYALFEEVCEVIKEIGIPIDTLFTIEKYKFAYQLFKSHQFTEFENFVKNLFVDETFSRYIDNEIVHIDTGIKTFPALEVACYPVYQGTQKVNGVNFEVIEVFKSENVSIRNVRAVEVHNAINDRSIPYELKGNKIYIPSEALQFYTEKAFNIAVDYSKYDTKMVYASYPSEQTENILKRKSFKIEFAPLDSIKIGDKRYFKHPPESVVTIKNVKLYQDVNFTTILSEVEPGTGFKIKGLKNSSNDIPRLETIDGHILTANLDFIEPLQSVDATTYMTECPRLVEVIKGCKLYTDRSFKNEAIRSVKVGERFEVETLIYTSNQTPRLKTCNGEYLTANKKFVKEV